MIKEIKNIFNKTYNIVNSGLDNYITKSRLKYYDDLEKYSVEYEDEIDAYGTNAQGWLEKKTPLDFEYLRFLSTASVVQAIILRKVNELSSFFHPQQNKYEPGFVIALKDDKEELKDSEKEELDKLRDFICNTGYLEGRKELSENIYNFEEWGRLILRDRLIYNQIGTERVFSKLQETGSKNKRLHSFYPVPAGSLRRAVYADDKDAKTQKELKQTLLTNVWDKNPQTEKEVKEKVTKDTIAYIQLYKGKIIRAFDRDELIYKFGNLTSEIDDNGYSQGELELALTVINAHVFTETHNRLYFTQGFSNKGILAVEKALGRKTLQQFKQQFRQQMQGTANSFRVPILSGTSIQWVPFQENLRDMEWREWMYYLIRIICAYFQMSPQEINFDISKGANTSSLGDGGKRQEEIFTHFKETGIRPLLRWIENIVNKEIIPYYEGGKYADKYVFKFVGVNTEQEGQEIERLVKEVGNYKTVNEVRAERDLEEIDNGDVILNQVWLQFTSQQAMQEQQGGGMFDFGEEGADNEQEQDLEGQPQQEGQEEIASEDVDIAEKALKKKVNKLSKGLTLHKVEWYKKDK